MTEDAVNGSGGRMRVPRSRGAISGVALIVLGLWGGLAPFIGPYFAFAFTPRPGTAWHWTAARGWYEVLPGGVALVGGLLLLVSANRVMTSLGAWLAVVAGGWFVVGPSVAPLISLGAIGSPAASGAREQAAETLTFFTALGAVIVLFGALAAGRLSVRSVRDVRVAARRDAEEKQAEDERLRAADEQRREDDLRAAAPAAAGSEAASEAARPGEPSALERSTAAEPAAVLGQPTTEEQPVTAEQSTTADRPATADQPAAAEQRSAHEPPAHEQPVATSAHPDAPYAPDGHTPAADEPPADAVPQQGGPAYQAPQRYVRRPSEQIPVEQIQRDHPTS